MTLFHSIILGLIQGLTEFFPISSSGHLIIIRWFLGLREHPLIFDIVLHGATFCAIIIYFREDWINILREGFISIRRRTLKDSGEGKLFWNLIIASIPAALFAIAFGKEIEHHFRNPMIAALILGMFGLVLYITELYGKKDKPLTELTWQPSLLIGLSQMLAIIPGVSRSGITISMAMVLGFNRESSVRFSFLLGTPIIFAAACYGIGKLTEINSSFSWNILLVGFIAAFLSSIIAIHFLIKYIKRHPFTIFVIYRLAVSVIVVVILFWRR